MNKTTKAFILYSIPYTKKSYIIHSLTPMGRTSFFLPSISPKNKSYEYIKIPLINVEITYNELTTRQHLYRIEQMYLYSFPEMLSDHVLHGAVASFMSEIIIKLTPQDLYDTQLYDIVSTFADKLNKWEKIPNTFILSFMANILDYLGILSRKNYSTEAMPHYESLLNTMEYLFLQPINSPDDDITIPSTPYHLLNLTIQYLQTQDILTSEVKSLKVLREVFY